MAKDILETFFWTAPMQRMVLQGPKSTATYVECLYCDGVIEAIIKRDRTDHFDNCIWVKTRKHVLNKNRLD